MLLFRAFKLDQNLIEGHENEKNQEVILLLHNIIKVQNINLNCIDF